jgi:hypothetical protein
VHFADVLGDKHEKDPEDTLHCIEGAVGTAVVDFYWEKKR